MNPETVKFKAKLKGVKKLVEVLEIDLECGNITTDTNFYGESKYNEVIFFKDVEELLPYTGFKDKEGNEIYEGDILKYPNGAIGKVGYDKYNIIKVISLNNKGFANIIDWPYMFFVDDYSFKPHTTIIGNVYEED